MRKKLFFYENNIEKNKPFDILNQPIDQHDLEVLDSQFQLIQKDAEKVSFLLVAFLIEDWNKELSPWKAPAVFGKESFGGGAGETLRYIENTLLPEIDHCYPGAEINRIFLGGYSLAGLFALWAAHQTALFYGIAAVSPSVWFPGWETYMREHSVCAEKVYLSLGNKEEKTKNKVMAKVGENIRCQYELLLKAKGQTACILEWNEGNHFVNSDVRIAKGFGWLLSFVMSGTAGRTENSGR